MNKVTMYTTPYCVYCKMAKVFFEQNKVDYEEKDVALDIKARENMIQRSGQMGVPVFEVGGKIVIGFDRPRLAELIGIKK